MVTLSVDNAWPRGEATFHSIPFFSPLIIILFITVLAIGIGVFVYLKMQKRKKQ